MIKSEQLWMKFVRDGFICGDMEGAKRAFLAALDIANGVKSYDDDAVRRKIDEEINYIWCDEYTNHVLSKIGIGRELKQKMLQDEGLSYMNLIAFLVFLNLFVQNFSLPYNNLD